MGGPRCVDRHSEILLMLSVKQSRVILGGPYMKKSQPLKDISQKFSYKVILDKELQSGELERDMIRFFQVVKTEYI